MKCAWVNRWKREGGNVDITGSRVINTARNDNIEYINKDLISQPKYPCARGSFVIKYMRMTVIFTVRVCSVTLGYVIEWGRCWAGRIYLV
jgi:hypothetical protein